MRKKSIWTLREQLHHTWGTGQALSELSLNASGNVSENVSGAPALLHEMDTDVELPLVALLSICIIMMLIGAACCYYCFGRLERSQLPDLPTLSVRKRTLVPPDASEDGATRSRALSGFEKRTIAHVSVGNKKAPPHELRTTLKPEDAVAIAAAAAAGGGATRRSLSPRGSRSPAKAKEDNLQAILETCDAMAAKRSLVQGDLAAQRSGTPEDGDQASGSVAAQHSGRQGGGDQASALAGRASFPTVKPPPPPEKVSMPLHTITSMGGRIRNHDDVFRGTSSELKEKLLQRHVTSHVMNKEAGEKGLDQIDEDNQDDVSNASSQPAPEVSRDSSPVDLRSPSPGFQERLAAARARETQSARAGGEGLKKDAPYALGAPKAKGHRPSELGAPAPKATGQRLSAQRDMVGGIVFRQGDRQASPRSPRPNVASPSAPKGSVYGPAMVDYKSAS